MKQADYAENFKGDVKGYKFFTFYVGHDFSAEEIDVIAVSEQAARDFVKNILETTDDYVPGMQIMHVVERPKGFMFF